MSTTPAPAAPPADTITATVFAVLDQVAPADVGFDRETAVEAVRTVLHRLEVPAALCADWTDSAFRYYKRVGIVSPPVGTTSNALYGRRQVLEAAAVRAGGALRAVSIEEARARWAGTDEAGLATLLATWADRLRRQGVIGSGPSDGTTPRPLPSLVRSGSASASPSTPSVPPAEGTGRLKVRQQVQIALPDGVQVFVPVGHPARSDAAARAALLAALEYALATVAGTPTGSPVGAP